VKLREGEREDDCENGAGEGWDFPVFALAYDYVEIAADLIALLIDVMLVDVFQVC
jgi:hypothetical protein